ncbi:hypothetical protein CVT26_015149 [Gymnopilus dilepis]|uniref:Ecp2 effector protein domain-containing protein n=1 Tax=Gymnopilus dilepis TaxID=231916 RepID=A0A409WA07_9AGAR|nr:hypothetical protein CVT26_015149 [Gymnopilus dilepis]
MRSFFALLAAAASFVATVSAVPTASTDATVIKVFDSGVVESSISADEYLGGALQKRQTIDLSGATCQSTCSGSPGPGPNQNDCNVIINQLLGEGATKFSVNPNTVIFLTFNSCRVNFVNTTPDVVVYQGGTDNDWGSVASFLAGACNAAHGFSQGQCTFDEQPNAFIQVLHS